MLSFYTLHITNPNLSLILPLQTLSTNREEGTVVTIAGRISRRATQGKLFFYDLSGDGAKVQKA